MSDVELRRMNPADYPQVVELNNAAIPAVTATDETRLAALVDMCAAAMVVADGDVIDGFALALPPGQAYASANYGWVGEHYTSFVYLDRIVIRPDAKGQGWGRRLYDAVRAASSADWFVLEVNSRPANEESLGFHERLGFTPVGTAEPYGDGTEVTYFAQRMEAR